MELTQKILAYDILATLEKREQDILKLYYIAGYTEEEIAEFYLISHPRVHKIKQKALEKCKKLTTEKQSYVITA